MTKFDISVLMAAPTIEQRVSLGLQLNRLEGGAIVPFPKDWEPSMLEATFRAGGGGAYHRLRQDGFEPGPQYFYHDPDGLIIGMAQRLDRGTEKTVLPIRASEAIGCNPKLEVKALDPFRPLYNLPGIAADSDKWVLVTEGEKAADAAKTMFPDHVLTTWSGGCKAVKFADWRPLIGRQVIIWPDHDVPGWSAARELGEILQLVGVRDLRVVNTPVTFPQGWDLADLIPVPDND